jgi:high-affinity nickel permease
MLGIALGMRHAVEPDHLAAVSTLATEQRTVRAGLLLGALWGVGHSFSLLLVGGTLSLLGEQMPVHVGAGFEMLVALMIVALGIRAVLRSVVEGSHGAVATHHHGTMKHTHSAPAEHVHLRSVTFATRPLLVGLVHGLAGSGALTALVLAEQRTITARLGFIALFGAGSIIGMALLTGLAGVPLMRVARAPRLAAAVLALSGLLSIGIGLLWGLSSAQQLFTFR